MNALHINYARQDFAALSTFFSFHVIVAEGDAYNQISVAGVPWIWDNESLVELG